MSVFGAYGAYYDLLNANKDYAGEADYVERLIRRHVRGGRILDLGCGTGRHAALLASRGFEVLGVDRSEDMLAHAHARAAGVRGLQFAIGDARTFRAERTFDAVISLFHVVSYQAAQEDVESMFATARAHLDAGGIFVFDVWYGPAVLTDRPAHRERRFEDERIEVVRTAEPEIDANENLVDVRYDIRVREKSSGREEIIRETHRMRYFFAPELRVLLHAAGFELTHHEEWMSGRPAGFDTWSVCFIATAAAQNEALWQNR
jgi:SAM-dependent methyltransferase